MFGGVPLFVRTASSLDVPGSVKRGLTVAERRGAIRSAVAVLRWI